jgi:hypothetical protein
MPDCDGVKYCGLEQHKLENERLQEALWYSCLQPRWWALQGDFVGLWKRFLA